jgi:hypothetical protein
MSPYDGQHDMKWTAKPSPFCGGKVQSGCGFPASFVRQYRDYHILQFALENTNDCLAASSNTNYVVQIRTCGKLASAFVPGSCGNGPVLSLSWSPLT